MRVSLTPVRERLYAVLCDGRGQDGSLGSLAQLRSVAAGRYVRSKRLQNVEGARALRDPSYPLKDFDRAAAVEWSSTANEPDASNPRDGYALRVLGLSLTVGYVVGAGMTRSARVVAPETQAWAAEHADQRAIEDADEMALALALPDLVGGNGLAPSIVGALTRVGPSVVRVLPSGDRMICESRYELTIEYAIT